MSSKVRQLRAVERQASQSETVDVGVLLGDIRGLIDETRAKVTTAVNAGLTLLYWQIGKRLCGTVLNHGRATYGEEVIGTLARQLTVDYGRGFSKKNLHHMIRFAEAFPDEQIVSTLWRQLSWSHFRRIIYIKDPPQTGLLR